MTSRGNQSVSPPAQISQQRHVNIVSSSTPPPQQYFQAAPSALQQGAYEFLPQTQGQAYLPYQVQVYGNTINDIRGQSGNSGRGGPHQQGLPQGGGFYQPHGPNMRPQQIQQGPTANQYFLAPQQRGPHPLNPQQQMMYFSQNFSPGPGSSVYSMPAAVYGGQPTVPVYPQNPYMMQNTAAYQPSIVCYPNGTQWRNTVMAPTGAPYSRPKKYLNITDPDTGRNITEEIVTHKSQSVEQDDGYEQVPLANKSEKEIVCQNFTRMVAESLKADESGISGVVSDSPAAIGGGPTGPSQQYQQPPHQQQIQPQPPLSKGPAPIMRAPMNGPPPTIPHQVMPHRSGMGPQPPASVTPPHDMSHQMLNVNLSMPPPQLPMRQPAQVIYNPTTQQQQHPPHLVPHQQQTSQHQPTRPQMPPSMPVPHQQVQVQSQSPHQGLPNQPAPVLTPPFTTQIPSSMVVIPCSQPVRIDPFLPEPQKLHVEAIPQNIPTVLPEPPVPTPAPFAKTSSPVREESPDAPYVEQMGDIRSPSSPPSVQTAMSFGEEDTFDKSEETGKDDCSHGANTQAAKDGRKGKKNWKGLNRKEIGGSDMDAFIDKMDETNGEASESHMSRTNNALETSAESFVNVASISESSVSHAAFEAVIEVKQGTATNKAAENADFKDKQKGVLTPESSLEVQSDSGYTKDKDNVEHQKQSSAAAQVESKHKQKQRKKKKGHQSPPNQKSKQNSASNDVSEKHEKVDTDKKPSPSSTITDIKESQSKPTAQQGNSSALQPAQQDKSAAQDFNKIPSSSSILTKEDRNAADKELSPELPEPIITTPSQQDDVDTRADRASLTEDSSVQIAASTADSVISANSLEASINQNQQVKVEDDNSIQSNHLLEPSNTPLENDLPSEPVQTEDSISDSLKINNEAIGDENKPSQDLVSKEESDKKDSDSEVAPKTVSSEKTASKFKKGGKEKLQYDRAYLMELRECPSSQEKPEGLPDLEIILDLPLINTSRGSNATPLDFTPAFFQPSGNQRNAPQIGQTNSRNRQRPDMQMPQRVIKSVSLQDSLKLLHQSEKPWKPITKQITAGEVAEKKKTLESDVLFIMNRLTPTNFERLAEEMKNLNIRTYEDLQQLVNILFDKVTIETKFVEAYALLCKYISGLKVPPPANSNIKESQATFRVVLLTKCQHEFEADKTSIFEDPEEKRRKMEAELPETPDRAALIDNTLYQMKMRRLKFYGNIRFIGELFKLGMLTETIMHDCIYRLLKAKDDDSLLSLCNLIATVGHALDTDKAKPRMDSYFVQMAKIAEERKSRIKFTLKDVIDLRSNNWVPRKEQTGPKKIDEVHKDFQQEQATKQFMQSQPMAPRMETAQQNNRRGNRQRQDEKQQVTDDGWNTVGSKSQKIDVSKMRLSKNVVDENIQLGPGGGMKQFSMWGKGSYGGSQPSQDNERPPSNRFSALRGEDDRRSYQRSPTRGDGGSARSTRQGPSAGHGRGKVPARLSQEDERRDALRNARSAAGGRSQNSSRDNSWNREDTRQPVIARGSREGENPMARSNGSLRPGSSLAPTPAAPVATAAAGFDDGLMLKKLKPLSEQEMAQKAKTILEEYLNARDLEEAKLCMMELQGQAHLHCLVTASINEVLEKSSKDRDLTGSFFHEMIKHSLLPMAVYFKGLEEVLTYAEDMVIDIPMMWTYMAQIIVPVLVGGSVSWPELAAVLKTNLSRRCCAKLIAEILLIAKEKTSEHEVAEAWQNSRMNWEDYLDPEDRSQFLKDKKLGFTVEPVAARAPSKASGPNQMDLQKFTEDIEAIVRRNGSHNEVYTFIDKHIAANKLDKHFIRAIVTAIVNAAISPATKKFSEDVLKSRKEVLNQYIRNDPEMELQALYAIQALMHKLEHPSGVIASIFDILCDEEVISEDTFKHWEKSTDPQEAEGKGACSMQLTQFFTWLQENDELETS